MSSFASILAQLVEQDGGPLLGVDDTDPDEAAAVETVRRGMRLRGQTDPDDTFWAEFAQLASSNRTGLAKLLGVRPEAVARWPRIVRHYLDKVHRADQHHDGQKKPQVLGTGFNAPTPRPPVKVVGTMGDSNAPAVGSAPY
jgi:hypothetical protein